jgi:hypothetical protein
MSTLLLKYYIITFIVLLAAFFGSKPKKLEKWKPKPKELSVDMDDRELLPWISDRELTIVVSAGFGVLLVALVVTCAALYTLFG